LVCHPKIVQQKLQDFGLIRGREPNVFVVNYLPAGVH